ncbi:hypothetical protein BC830DRAFT_1095625 [Chytriomyces sp. MP71]|nr:hypothetical protein BC830DRAFT_1095625 [Chytriomyces sp. MP71]
MSNQQTRYSVSCAKAALRALDLAMLRGGYIDWAPIAAPLVTLATHMKSKNTFTKRSMLEAARNQIQTPHNAVLPQQYLHDASARSIPRIDARDISVESFTREYMEANPPRPVILIHALDAWPASALWKSLDYLHETAGDRLVPVETCSAEDAGRSFLSHTWSHRIMSFSDYIQRYVVRDPVTVALDEDESQAHGYLAQHPLLDQVPALREDIIVPVFCRAHTAEDNARPVDCDFRSEPLVSAWFGPKDTVSPIHNDPYHNTLAQIVGSKYVRIYETSVTDRLYPTKSRLGHNSQVDLDDVDELHFPLFKGTPCWQAVLQAGELLYIPRLNWHYVRSLEMSISASFWFGAKMELIEGKEKGTYGVEYVRKHDPGKSLMIQ